MIDNLNGRLNAQKRNRILSLLFAFTLIFTSLINTVQAFVKPPGIPGSVDTDLVESRSFSSKVSIPYKEFEYSTLDASEIDIPYIKLNSEDAKKANSELDDIESHFIEEYEKCIDYDIGPLGSIDYEVYKDDDILSVVVEMTNLTAGAFIEHRAYTFSLPDGKILTDDEILKKFGVGENIDTIIEENILRQCRYYSGNIEFKPSAFKATSLLEHWGLPRESNRFYIDRTGKLSAIYTVATLAGSGYIEVKRPLDILNQLSKDELNPIFVKMANGLDIDPNSVDEKGFIAYLGSSEEGEELKNSLRRLISINQKYLNSYDLLYKMDSEDGFKLKGDEIYFVVPKYKNTVVMMINTDEDGNESGYVSYDEIGMESVLSIQNYQNKVNSKLSLIYRDEIFDIIPKLENGKFKGVDGLIDIEKLIQVDNQAYDENLYEFILDLK
ncbi:MAG: hypothetical protein Q4P34_02310 [Tissierellia bacterium]|nr:hypothetical protein [Tissierellia bacterium]